MNDSAETSSDHDRQAVEHADQPLKPAHRSRMHDQDAIDRATFTVLGRQRLAFGIVAGLIAAVVSALVWAALIYFTGYEIGWLAIGIGFLVGLAVQIGGKGVTPTFGIVGGALSVVAILLGKFFAFVMFVSDDADIGIVESVSFLLDPEILSAVYSESFSAIDLLFYGIAIWQGFKLGFRDLGLAVNEVMHEARDEDSLAKE